MQLYEIRRHFMRGLDLIEVGFNEDADRDTAIMQECDNFLDLFALSRHVQSTLSREFLPFFRDKSNQIRFDSECDLSHRVVRRHFQVELRADDVAQELKVPVLNVPTVFAQMDNQSVCARKFGENGGSQRVEVILSGISSRKKRGGARTDSFTLNRNSSARL
jgi:hypothetical protein